MTDLIYSQRSGAFGGPGISATGYSGHDAGVNNPDMQEVHGVGPIPRGKWKIGKPENHPHLGPLAIPLTPCEGTDAFGRSGFFIHGDNQQMNRTASHGCIILSHDVRAAIVAQGCADLEVVE